MKKLHALSIALLLVFLTFTALQKTNGPSHSHPYSKAILFLDDLTAKSQWDDKSKHPIVLHFFFILAFMLPRGIILQSHRSRIIVTKLLFLLPVFHQANYVILPPKF